MIEKLRADLKALPMTQMQIAKATGISYSWVQKFMGGKFKDMRTANYSKLRLLADSSVKQ